MWTFDNLRIERRAVPQLERIRRLHVVVSVEQNTRRLRAGGTGIMPEHDGMPGSRLDRDLESKARKLVAEPLGRVLHIRLMQGCVLMLGMRSSSNRRSRA